MENRAFVTHWTTIGAFIFACAELAKVFDCPIILKFVVYTGIILWNSISVEFEFHTALGDAGYCYVEEHDWI